MRTVLTGRLRMFVGGAEHGLGPGDVEAGVIDDGAVIGDEPVTRVVVCSPGGMESFFEQLAAIEDAPRDALRLALEHGWRFD